MTILQFLYKGGQSRSLLIESKFQKIPKEYLESSLSKLLIRMSIHHCSTWPLHICSFHRCLIGSHCTIRAHNWAWRRPETEGSLSPWDLTELGKTSIVLHKWKLNFLHIKRWQAKALISWKAPDIPVSVHKVVSLIHKNEIRLYYAKAKLEIWRSQWYATP